MALIDWCRLRIAREVAFIRALHADPRVPAAAYWLLMLALAYALSPIDLIPDFIPIIGLLDDIIVVPLLVLLAIKLIPPEVIRFHRDVQQRREQEDHAGTDANPPVSGGANDPRGE